MYTLILNDPQIFCLPKDEDLAGYAPLLAMEREIKIAREANCDIVAVKYLEMGPIHPRVRQLLAGYKRVLMVGKDQWNGASEILQTCKEFGFSAGSIRICGFYTHRCVQSTVRGLKVLMPDCRIDVVKDACDDYEGNRWSTFPKLPGVSLV